MRHQLKEREKRRNHRNKKRGVDQADAWSLQHTLLPFRRILTRRSDRRNVSLCSFRPKLPGAVQTLWVRPFYLASCVGSLTLHGWTTQTCCVLRRLDRTEASRRVRPKALSHHARISLAPKSMFFTFTQPTSPAPTLNFLRALRANGMACT